MAKQNRDKPRDRGSREKRRAPEELEQKHDLPTEPEQIRGQSNEPPKPQRQPGRLPLPD
jgi:hypothetical protein